MSALTPEAGPLAFSTIILLTALVCVLCRGIYGKELNIRCSGWFVAFLAMFLVWMLFTLSYSVDRFTGGKMWITFISYAIVAFLTLQYAAAGDERRFLLSCILATGAALSAHALFHRIFIIPAFNRWLLADPERFLSVIGLGEQLTSDLISRARAGHVYGVFLTGNQFGSYILLFAFPLGAIIAVRAGKVFKKGIKSAGLGEWTAVSALVLCFAYISLAFVLSGSKGAIMSALIAGGAFTLFLCRHKFRRNLKLTMAIACLMLLAGFFSYVADFPDRSAMRRSMEIRRGYWDVSRKMLAGKTLTGVGAGGWKDHYTMLKSPWYEETQLPHSFYFLVLSETGLIGLLLILAALFAAFAASVRGIILASGKYGDEPGQPGGAPRAPPPKAGCIPAGLILLFDYFFLGSMVPHRFASPQLLQALPWLLYAFVFIVWVAVFLLLYNRQWLPSDGKNKTVSLGILCGLCAFFVHIGVEFSMVIPAAGGTAFALLGLSITGEGGVRIPLNKLTTVIIAAPAFAITFLLAAFVTPAALEDHFGQDAAISIKTGMEEAPSAELRIEKKRHLADHYRQMVGLEPLFEGSPRPTNSGISIRKWDGEMWFKLAENLNNLSLLESASGREELGTFLKNEAGRAAEEAIRLRPLRASHYRVMGIITHRTGKTVESIEYFRQAANLHPTLPFAWYEYGKALEMKEGLTPEVCRIYRKTEKLNNPDIQYHDRNLLSDELSGYIADRIEACRDK